jgi:hypothetical protein
MAFQLKKVVVTKDPGRWLAINAQEVLVLPFPAANGEVNCYVAVQGTASCLFVPPIASRDNTFTAFETTLCNDALPGSALFRMGF